MKTVDEATLERIWSSPGPHHPAEIALLVMQIRELKKENQELSECLRRYIENDDTNEGGRREEVNANGFVKSDGQ
jgi:hypothetical protein